MSLRKWRVAQATVTGQSHINQATECQDRALCCNIKTGENEVLIAVVADGAGSTTDGQRGAEIACELFVSQITEFLKVAPIESLNEDFGQRWLNFFQAQIREVAAYEKKELREFSSTLVSAVIGEKYAVFYQIGDGNAVFSINGKAGSYEFSLPPAESEYVNMTDFLTDETAAEKIRFACLEETIEDVILFSDGISAVAINFQTNKPHEPFLMPMIAPLRRGQASKELNEKLKSFLSSPKINEKSDDDKTIILASRANINQG